MLDDRVRLVAMSWIPTQGGLVNPAAAVGAVTRGAGVPYLLDACQAAGQLPDRRRRARVRLPLGHRAQVPARHRAAPGSSTCGGRGSTGLEPPFLDVHAAQWAPGDAVVIRDDARRFESWEHSVANRLGLGAAVDYALALGVDAIAAARRSRSRRRCAAQLGQRARPRRSTTAGVEQCGIVTFTIDGVDVYELAARLRERGASTSRCRPSTSPRYDFEARGARPPSARASVHYYNTEDELTRLVDAVGDCTARSPRSTSSS